MQHLQFVFVSLVGDFLAGWFPLNLFPLGKGKHCMYLVDVNSPVILYLSFSTFILLG